MSVTLPSGCYDAVAASNQGPSTLAGLNEHVLLNVIFYLNTAKSVSALSQTCRRLHAVVHSDGWRVFVQTRFSNLDVPTATGQRWDRLANALTWQMRCWERRSIQLSRMKLPSPPQQHARGSSSAARTAQNRQTAPYKPVLAAHLDHRTGDELVVVGAGENIEAHFSCPASTWYHVPGSHHGFVAGRDDVTSIALMERDAGEDACMVVGRAYGSLHLVSASRHSFGRTMCRLEVPDHYHQHRGTRETGQHLARTYEIRSVDTFGQDYLVCANTYKHVLLYNTSSSCSSSLEIEIDNDSVGGRDAELDTLHPAHATSRLQEGRETPTYVQPIQTVKFLRKNLIAVARHDQLEYLSVTPFGLEGGPTFGCCYPPSDGTARRNGRSSILRAIEPVRALSLLGGGDNLLLSAWDDGSVR